MYEIFNKFIIKTSENITSGTKSNIDSLEININKIQKNFIDSIDKVKSVANLNKIHKEATIRITTEISKYKKNNFIKDLEEKDSSFIKDIKNNIRDKYGTIKANFAQGEKTVNKEVELNKVQSQDNQISK